VTAFLSALGGKLAERWLALLVLPGLLFLTAVAVAATLGQRGWSDVAALRDQLNTIAAEPALRSTGTVVLVLIAVLAGAAGAGLIAQALGGGWERLWLTDSRVFSTLTSRRTRRWTTADENFRAALVAAGKAKIADSKDAKALATRAAELNAARNRIALATPWTPGPSTPTSWTSSRRGPGCGSWCRTRHEPNSPRPARRCPRQPGWARGVSGTSSWASGGGRPRWPA
jgi:hypothetical protein